jgi:tRNA1(Val) A37 N6-methylase TrmN6
MGRGTPMTDVTTDDRLLDGRVRLRQPAEGFRTSIEAVLLAAAVPATDGDMVLDVGAGTGAAALCLAARVQGVQVTGIEAERGLVRLAGDNAEDSGLATRCRFYLGNLAAPPVRLSPASFDHVMANPPFLSAGTGRSPRHSGRVQAMVEGDVTLSGWLDFCLRMVRQGGTVTVIHRADRLDELLSGLTGRLGALVVLPLWPHAGEPAKRVIVTGRRGSGAPLTLLPGLVLHRPDGSYTPAAEKVLRAGEGIDLGRPQRPRP